jgi:hypothetical protein
LVEKSTFIVFFFRVFFGTFFLLSRNKTLIEKKGFLLSLCTFYYPSKAPAKRHLMQKCIFATQRTAPSCEMPPGRDLHFASYSCEAQFYKNAMFLLLTCFFAKSKTNVNKNTAYKMLKIKTLLRVF